MAISSPFEYSSNAHRDDAVSMVDAALDRGRAGAIYHASDAEPAPRAEVVRWIAARLGIEPARSTASPPAGRGGNRRIDATASRAELGVVLRYRSFREGYREAIAAARALS